MTFTSSELLLTLMSATAVILVLIFAVRQLFAQHSNRLTQELEGENTSNLIKKLPPVDAFKLNSMFLRVGLMCSLGFVLVAFNWTIFENATSEFIVFEEGFIDTETPLVPPPVRKMPPPPSPIIEDVPDDMVEEDIDISDIFEEFEIDNITDPVDYGDKEVKKVKIKEEKIDEDIDEPNFFVRVEEMPAFPGCDIADEEEKRICTEKKLFQHIYKNLDYPIQARENNIEGLVVISFMVDKDGTITDVGILKDIGAGCGDAAVDAIKSMNNLPQRWKPGKQRTQNVKVKYNIPVRFKLK